MMSQHGGRSVAGLLATRLCRQQQRRTIVATCRSTSIGVIQRYPAFTRGNSRSISQRRQQQQQLRRTSSGKATDAAVPRATAKTGDVGSNAAAANEQVGGTSNEEAIRATREAIQALKDAKRARTSSSSSSETSIGGTGKQSSADGTTLWSKVRMPFLFGTGLYLGLVSFGDHRDSKRGSDYLAELKASFEDVDKKR
mmetsp:Transcript_33322/g.73041  ORF Transcript_33322/g.73041 Transcript_33322/m.73041 type:complete len:197 (+) Transcript_33322:87-677(+)